MESHNFLVYKNTHSSKDCAVLKLGCDTWREILAFRTLALSVTARTFMVPFSGASIKISNMTGLDKVNCRFGNIILGLHEEIVQQVHKTKMVSNDVDTRSRVTLAIIWIIDTLTDNFDRSPTGANFFADMNGSWILLDAARWKFGSVSGVFAKNIKKYYKDLHAICDPEKGLPMLLMAKHIVDEICGLVPHTCTTSVDFRQYIMADPFFHAYLEESGRDDLDLFFGSSEQGKKGKTKILKKCKQDPHCKGSNFLVTDTLNKMQDIKHDIYYRHTECLLIHQNDSGQLPRVQTKMWNE